LRGFCQYLTRLLNFDILDVNIREFREWD